MKAKSINPDLYKEVKRLGAKDMEVCMQCGKCASACVLSVGENTFPRKIYRYLQLGLRDKLMEAPEPWLCYYCGDCNQDCPRGAEPAETMMAARRWLITQYDWTGLAAKFYASPKWEVGFFAAIALFVVSLFAIFHGPVVTDHVALNTFAPAEWVHIGDQVMILIIFTLLFANAFKMYTGIMQGTKVPLYLYITQAPVFIINYFTQKRWRKCGTGPSSAWWRHFFLFSGWVTMEVLVMIYLTSFQTDVVHPFWYPTRLFGYYATIALMFGSTTMLYSRWFKKDQALHRYSDFTDVFFLVQIVAIAVTGILVHFCRLAGFPILTYTIYVFHVAICVAMLVLMLPFGKLSHLMYRPLAIFLTTIKQKAIQESKVDKTTLTQEIGEAFKSCMQCGTCTGSCPWTEIKDFSPRLILRNIALDRASVMSVDTASWTCATCNSCVENCPRGIGIVDLIKSIRRQVVEAGFLPGSLNNPIKSLKKEGNPWGGKQADRMAWTKDFKIPAYQKELEYCLFNCCTTAYDTSASQGGLKGGLALLRLLEHSGVSYGTLGTKENCCGDMVDKVGAADVAQDLKKKNTEMFLTAGASKILTVSPHCLNTFSKDYEGLKKVEVEHYTELLDNLVQEGTIKPVKEVNLKVTYHDPCYLGRHSKVYDAPRRVLGAIPGLELTEMQNNRERSFCCGGGGGGSWKDTASDESLGEIRVQQALATGASVIATACPYCIRMLNEAIALLNVGNKIHVQDISELLLQSVDLSDTSGKTGSKNMSYSQEECHV